MRYDHAAFKELIDRLVHAPFSTGPGRVEERVARARQALELEIDNLRTERNELEARLCRLDDEED